MQSTDLGLRQALAGKHEHPTHEALEHTVTTYGIPPQYLEDVIDGVEIRNVKGIGEKKYDKLKNLITIE
jgi:phytoene/squalene synthetase